GRGPRPHGQRRYRYRDPAGFHRRRPGEGAQLSRRLPGCRPAPAGRYPPRRAERRPAATGQPRPPAQILVPLGRRPHPGGAVRRSRKGGPRRRPRRHRRLPVTLRPEPRQDNGGHRTPPQGCRTMTPSDPQPRIVIVDDDPLVLALLRHQLGALGFERVATLGSAREAMALLGDSRQHPCLMLCDLDMPHIDGIELVRDLGGIGYQGGVVLVCGEDVRVLQTAEKLAEAHQLRVLGALRKPISPADLSTVLALQAKARKVLGPSAGARGYTADELARGIAGGQLVNHYQPVVHLASGDIMGVETLVRWQHPEHGLVGPDQFIGLAEDNGLIDDLT